MSLRVERDDLELERLALAHDVARVGDPLVAELADVDEALEPVADADEGAEVDELRDGPVDDVADPEVGHRRVPGVRLEAADREADPAALVVDVDDLGLDLVADLVAGLGVVDLVPAELALVDEAVDPAEVDEDAERRDRAHRAGDLLAHLEAAEELVALLATLLVQGHLLREDQAVRLPVDLEDLEPKLPPDVRLQLLGDLLGCVARLLVLGPTREVDDLADRDEPADAAVDDEAALVVVDDRRLDDDARLELLLHRAPLPLEARSAEREDHVALRRLRLQDVDQDGVAHRQRGGGLGVAAVELAVADDAFALRPDVDQDLVAVDSDDRAFDDVAVLEAADLGILLGQELLHRGGLGAGGHGPDGLGRRLRRLGDLVRDGLDDGRLGGQLLGQGLNRDRLGDELLGDLLGYERRLGEILGDVLRDESLGDELLRDLLGREGIRGQHLGGLAVAGRFRGHGLLGELVRCRVGEDGFLDQLLRRDAGDHGISRERVGLSLNLGCLHCETLGHGVRHDRLARELLGGLGHRHLFDHCAHRIGARRCLGRRDRRVLRRGLRGGRLLLLFRQGFLLLVWIPPRNENDGRALLEPSSGMQVRSVRGACGPALR